ncbi:hypothetical protein H4R21_001690 [Coemansia helicoidea]|uniref:Uncharacterized protein n=1 Tax=Coemansia helicoidea TaxID=1286919 RepID=A0ACC1LAJ8_9FUNG|nr:hypothetical protein H4R21_001690 [Coemansia helicoidea]
MSVEPARVKALGQAMLLDSLLDHASRMALGVLNQRLQLGRLQEDPHAASVDAGQIRGEAAALYPTLQGTLAVVDKLRARAENSEPSEGLRARLAIQEFLRVCYSDILPAPLGATPLRALPVGDPTHDSPEQHYLWTLVRPSQPPVVVVQMFLALSAQIAQLPRSRFDAAQSLMVGRMWYRLLVDLLAQLALSAREFGEYSAEQVRLSMDLVSPGSSSRASLHPSLWCTADSEHIAQFDAAWRDVRQLVASVAEPSSPASRAAELAQLCSPHDFSHNLGTYLKAVADRLDPPLLKVYSNIHQSGSFPRGFFDGPGLSPAHPRPVGPHPSAGAYSDDRPASPMLLDPFSPRPPVFAQRALPLSAAENDHGLAPASAKLVRTRQLPMLTDGDADESCVSDMEMSPSQHASMKRQRSAGTTLPGAAMRTPPRRTLSADAHGLGDDSVDIENTVVMESPSAMLSARHDKRVRASVQRSQAPPTLCLAPDGLGSGAGPSLTCTTPPPAAGATSPMVTTPTSQARPPLGRGDVEGGGRPHRRRHYGSGAPGTPKGVQPSLLRAPPPQTLLSPRNIAAAQRRNVPLDTLIAESAGLGGSSDDGSDSGTGRRKRPRGSLLAD